MTNAEYEDILVRAYDCTGYITVANDITTEEVAVPGISYISDVIDESSVFPKIGDMLYVDGIAMDLDDVSGSYVWPGDTIEWRGAK